MGAPALMPDGPGPQREVLQAGERRLARVESLRALAALAVAVGHAWGIAHHHQQAEVAGSYLGRVVYGGGFGVFLFFALTGYLLFWPFAKRDFGGGVAIDLRRYARNRVVRILPLYLFAVVVLLLVQEGGGTGEQWWRFLLLMENFSLATVGTVDGALWSVVVEVHFYALLPVLAFAVARLARGRARGAVVALLVLAAASLAVWLVQVTWAQRPSPVWRYNLPATLFFFVPGMLLALLRLELQRRRPAWLDGIAGSSLVWLSASAALWLVVFYRYSLAPLAAVASFFAVGALVLPLRESAPRRVLDWGPLVAVGVVSYSLYVWHSRVQEHLAGASWFPDSTAAVFVVTIPLSIAVAFVSYRLIEEPFLRLRRRWSSASAQIDRDAHTGAGHLPAGGERAPA